MPPAKTKPKYAGARRAAERLAEKLRAQPPMIQGPETRQVRRRRLREQAAGAARAQRKTDFALAKQAMRDRKRARAEAAKAAA